MKLVHFEKQTHLKSKQNFGEIFKLIPYESTFDQFAYKQKNGQPHRNDKVKSERNITHVGCRTLGVTKMIRYEVEQNLKK